MKIIFASRDFCDNCEDLRTKINDIINLSTFVLQSDKKKTKDRVDKNLVSDAELSEFKS